jgi:hypothetical protein
VTVVLDEVGPGGIDLFVDANRDRKIDDGLLINVAYRGTPVSPAAQDYLGAVTTLASTDGQTLGTAHSGFA